MLKNNSTDGGSWGPKQILIYRSSSDKDLHRQKDLNPENDSMTRWKRTGSLMEGRNVTSARYVWHTEAQLLFSQEEKEEERCVDPNQSNKMD